MDNHIFKLDTKKSVKKHFVEKVSGAYGCALFLTGITSVVGVVFTIRGLIDQLWKEVGMAEFVQREFYFLAIVCIFIALIKVLIDEMPFSRTLSCCMRMVSVLYLVGAVLFPRLPGYESSGFHILSLSSDFVLIDGAVLQVGLLLYIFSVLLEEGFKLQKELDEIL